MMKTTFAALALAAAILAAGFPTAAFSQPEQAASASSFTPFQGAIPADNVTRAMLGQDVVLSGVVIDVAPSTGDRVPHRFTLARVDGGGAVMVIYWPDSAESIHAGMGVPPVGVSMSARGQLSDYRGDLQIRVRDLGNIRIEGYPHTLGGPAAPAPSTAAASSAPAAPVAAPAGPQANEEGYFTVAQLPALRASMMNRELSMMGNVSEFRASWSDTAPNIISLADGGQTVEVVYWSDDTMGFESPGTPVYVTGLLQDYRGRLQLKVNDLTALSQQPLAEDQVIRPGAPAPEAATGPATSWPRTREGLPAIEPVSLGEGASVALNQIGRAHVGNTVTVQGEIFSLARRGDKDVVLLKGDNAMLTVLLPEGEAAPLSVGQAYEATGKLEWNELRALPELVAAP